MGDFMLYREDANVRNYDKLLKGTLTMTPLTRAYFSMPNLKAIQNAIRYNVWAKSSGKLIIAEQDETDLIIVMRSIYLQYGQNRPDNIAAQIEELNQRVYSSVLPGILSNALQYKQYLVDKFTMPMPLLRPTCMNSAGSKQLKSVTSTF